MPEQYQVAAYRHFQVAEHLEANSFDDDAGYHFGIAGENAVKHALQEAGLVQYWTANNQRPNDTPMRSHWGALQAKLSDVQNDIPLMASNRRTAPLMALASQQPVRCFTNWSINIRYADTTNVPVQKSDLQSWRQDATQFLIDFVF